MQLCTQRGWRRLKRKPRTRGPKSEPPIEVFEKQAAFCSIFADEKRLRILWFLQDGEKRVNEISERLGITLQNASQHLRLMRDKGALLARREGQAVYYRIANEKFLKGTQLVREGLLEELQRMRSQ